MKTLKTLILCTLFTIPFISKAQMGMGKPEEIEEIKKRKLIVIIEALDQDIIDKLTREKQPQYIEDYKAAVAQYNENLETSIREFWPYHKDFELKTYEQVQTLAGAESRYAVIWIKTIQIIGSSDRSHVIANEGLDWTYDDVKNGVEPAKEEKSDLKGTAFFIVNKLEDRHKTSVAQVGLPHTFPTKADIIYGIEYISWYMNNRSAGMKGGDIKKMASNAIRLKDYTLLVNKKSLKEKTTLATISEVYPYKVQILDDKGFDEAIINKTENSAYLIMTPFILVRSSSQSSMLYIPVVMDSKSGEVLLYNEPAGLGITSLGGTSSMINDRTFKEINSDIERALKRE